MSSALYSLGRWAVGARRLVLVAWIGLLVLAGGLAGLVGQGLDDEVTIPGTESQAALDRLAATFPQVSGASAQVVVVAPDGSTVEDNAVRGPVEDAVTALGDIDGVAAVTSPYDDTMPASVSDDDVATLMTVQLDEGQSEVTDATKDALGDVVDDLAAALPDGAQAALGGQLFSTEFPTLTVTEALGLLVALVVLVLTFGSFVAAGLPLLNAVVGVGVSMGLLFAATAVADRLHDPDARRHARPRRRHRLRAVHRVPAARRARDRPQRRGGHGAGRRDRRLGRHLRGPHRHDRARRPRRRRIPFLTVMGVAAAVGVGLAVLVSITLLPAMLGFAGERLRPKAPRCLDGDGDVRPRERTAEGRRGDRVARATDRTSGGAGLGCERASSRAREPPPGRPG